MTSNAIRAALACASLLALAGCMGPTYGTGVSQGQQLFNDLDNVVALGGNKERIDYTPRAELVKPKSVGVLPPPREPAASDPSLPESPEARRGRLFAAAPDTSEQPLPAAFATSQKEGVDPAELRRRSAAARSDVGRRAEIENNWVDPRTMAGQRLAVAERSSVGKQGSPEVRRYLSEPPLAYRAPASTAPVGDQGTDEEVKERRAKGTGTIASKLGKLWPF